MEPNLINTILTQLNLTFIIKPIALVLIGIYALFTLLVIRQVGLMTTFLGSGSTPLIKILAWGHFIATAALFLIVLFLI